MLSFFIGNSSIELSPDFSFTMMVTKNQVKRFPYCPMNLIVDLTIGDWGTKDHEETFVIKELEYVN
jgi:hypothetical protein